MLSRLPKVQGISSVYAVIAFMIQAWTINVFLWQYPSWLYYLNKQEILAIFAYRIAESFIETLFVLGILLLVSIILPPRFLRDVFNVRGTAFIVFMLGSIILFWNRFLDRDPGVVMADYLRIWTAAAVLLSVAISYASAKIKVVSSFLIWLSDRMIIFLFILIPMSLISLVVVVIRNV